ncbi:MAG: AAA family ATPase [Bradymonadia bacterium]|jgi:hypothetical protein
MLENSFLEQLSLQIEASFPLIVVETKDELALVDFIDEQAKRLGRSFYLLEQGMRPSEALRDFKLDSVVLLLHQDPNILFQELSYFLRQTARAKSNLCLILLGSHFMYPVQLRSRLSHFVAPLPSFDERRAFLLERLGGEDAELLEALAYNSGGLTLLDLSRILGYCELLARRVGSGFDWRRALGVEKRRMFSRHAALSLEEESRGLEGVGGLRELKQWLSLRKPAFSKRAEDFGLALPKGLLLVGVQGCGKSLFSRAVAAFWQFPLLRLDFAALFSAEAPAEAVFLDAIAVAESMAPVVLWIDEIEKAFSVSDASSMRIMGSLLQWLQNKQKAVFVVATANQIELLAPEFVRKGRFDEIFFIDLPDESAREEIFSIHLKQRGRKPADFDIARCVNQTENFSGAEIEQLIIAALHRAFSEERELCSEDILDAASETLTLYQQREDEIKALREWARGRTRFASENKRLLGFFRTEGIGAVPQK